MIYLKSLLVGIVAALVVTVLTFAIGFLLLSTVTMSGGLGAVSAPLYGFPYLSIAGFVVGFGWQFRKSLRRTTRA